MMENNKNNFNDFLLIINDENIKIGKLEEILKIVEEIISTDKVENTIVIKSLKAKK
jgi:hypothetical protein